jgi:predicted nucleic acid-binding Zn ribbon protein
MMHADGQGKKRQGPGAPAFRRRGAQDPREGGTASHGLRSMASVLGELMARRGLGRVQSAARCEEAWRAAVGPALAEQTRVGAVRRGKLEVIVAHSTLIQELNFQKPVLLETLLRQLPDQGITDVRFRLGEIGR